MSDTTLFAAILRPRPGSSLLDREVSSPSPLSENQNLVDQMVSSSLSEATKGSTLLAMVGAGAVSRLTRAGVMSFAFGEGTLLPLMARGGSYAIALANESATFAGIERGFHSVPSGTEFHPSQTSFEKDWARAFINLGSLKLLGGVAQGQNLILQHLLTDLGMVGGQQVGAKFGLVEKPQGSLAQQMVQAEALNWSQKGGMALLHGLSPNLLSTEKSLDLYLRSRESDLFSKGRPVLPFFPQLAMVANGGRGVFSVNPREVDESVYNMSSKEDNEGQGKKNFDSPRRPFDRSQFKLIDPAAFGMAEKNPSDEGALSAMSSLLEMVQSGDSNRRDEAFSGLMEFSKIGVKSLELAETLHKKAMELKAKAQALGRHNPLKQENYKRAMELGWSAASAVPPRNEFRRGHLYVDATWLALEGGQLEAAEKIILQALTGDFGAVAEDKLRRSAKKRWLLSTDRKFLLETLTRTKKHLGLLEALRRASEKEEDAFRRTPVTPHIFTISSREAGEGSGSTEEIAGPPEGKPSRDLEKIIHELTELAGAGNRAATEALALIATSKAGEMDAFAQMAKVTLRGISGERPLRTEGESIPMETKSVCINIGRYYFVENPNEDTTIETANLYVEHQGVGKGNLFITNKSDRDLFLMDSEGEPRRVEKGTAYPLLRGEKFIFNGKWYTWGKARNHSLPSPQGRSPLPVEEVQALNARILGEKEANAIFEAGVYYAMKLELLRPGREERTARIPVFLEDSSGLIAAVGKVPEELKSKTTPVTLVVRVPGQPTTTEKAPTVVGMVLPGTIVSSRILEVVDDLKEKVFRYPSSGVPAMEYGKVALDARRFRTVPFWEGGSKEELH